MTEIAVILPVRDGAELLRPVLACVAGQGVRVELLVVDDCSTDDTAAIARAEGARVLSMPRPSGPYAARNAGVAATAAPVVVFLDVRCRPRPGWLRALVAPLADPAVGVVGGEVIAPPGRTVAERYVGSRQPLSPRHAVVHPFLPYVPTCNLATRRAAIEAVGGFRIERSGGDLDLCWRIQLAGQGSVVLAPTAAVDWLPRTSMRALLRQWARYGRARPDLYARFAGQGLSTDPPPSRWLVLKREMRALQTGLRGTPRRSWDVELVDRLCSVVWERAYRKSYGEVMKRPA